MTSRVTSQCYSGSELICARWQRAMHKALIWDRAQRMQAERLQEQQQRASERAIVWEALLAKADPRVTELRAALLSG